METTTTRATFSLCRTETLSSGLRLQALVTFGLRCSKLLGFGLLGFICSGTTRHAHEMQSCRDGPITDYGIESCSMKPPM